MCWAYILRSEKNGRYYIGAAKDVEIRLAQHNSGKVKSTKHLRPWKVVYREGFSNFVEARQRETYLKSQKSRRVIEELLKTISSAG